MHAACSAVFENMLADGDTCCCNGEFDLREHLRDMQKADAKFEHGVKLSAPKGAPASADTPEVQPKGDSGYVHPDAWLGTRDIGTLADVTSTGRKRVARMYPISPGQVCEWAGKKHCGGGPVPIMGCINNPATDLHHGPDKNTLNNAKASRGIGAAENVHVVCSECHNAWHAANDPYYPEYDRQEQQAEPWLPNAPFEWGPQEMVPAEFDELADEERRRHEQRQKRGREHRGRNATARDDGDFSVEDDD
jgi:hypothetical protein